MFEINQFGTKIGTKIYKNEQGQLHREDGPAVERANGGKSWCINGVLHREDGPAAEFVNGDKDWYIDGVYYDLEDYHKKMLEKSKNYV